MKDAFGVNISKSSRNRKDLGNAAMAGGGTALVLGAANASRLEEAARNKVLVPLADKRIKRLESFVRTNPGFSVTQAGVASRRSNTKRAGGITGGITIPKKTTIRSISGNKRKVDVRTRTIGGRLTRDLPAGKENAAQRSMARKRLYTNLNNTRRFKNAVISGIPNKAKVPIMASAYLGGGALAWKGTRNLVPKDRVSKAITRRDVDNTFTGGAAGAGGYQLAMYATKPIDRRIERGWNAERDAAKRIAASSGGPPAETSHSIMAAHKKAHGISGTKLGDRKWLKYWRTTPDTVQGYKFKRTMSYLHGGKTGVALTTGVGALGAGGAIAAGRKNRVSKGFPVEDFSHQGRRVIHITSGKIWRIHSWEPESKKWNVIDHTDSKRSVFPHEVQHLRPPNKSKAPKPAKLVKPKPKPPTQGELF